MIIDRSDKEIEREGERGEREKTEGSIILSAVVTEGSLGTFPPIVQPTSVISMQSFRR